MMWKHVTISSSLMLHHINELCFSVWWFMVALKRHFTGAAGTRGLLRQVGVVIGLDHVV